DQSRTNIRQGCLRSLCAFNSGSRWARAAFGTAGIVCNRPLRGGFSVVVRRGDINIPMRIFAGKGAIYAAIALGVVTSYIAWNFVNQARPNQAAVETAPVVVANMAIPVRTLISPEMVRVQQMPVDAVHPQAMHSIDQVIGKVARIAMTGDEPVLTTKVFLQRG